MLRNHITLLGCALALGLTAIGTQAKADRVHFRFTGGSWGRSVHRGWHRYWGGPEIGFYYAPRPVYIVDGYDDPEYYNDSEFWYSNPSFGFSIELGGGDRYDSGRGHYDYSRDRGRDYRESRDRGRDYRSNDRDYRISDHQYRGGRGESGSVFSGRDRGSIGSSHDSRSDRGSSHDFGGDRGNSGSGHSFGGNRDTGGGSQRFGGGRDNSGGTESNGGGKRGNTGNGPSAGGGSSSGDRGGSSHGSGGGGYTGGSRGNSGGSSSGSRSYGGDRSGRDGR